MGDDFLKTKGILGPALRQYMDCKMDRTNHKNPSQVKERVLKVYDNINDILRNVGEDIVRLSTPLHPDPDINTRQRKLLQAFFTGQVRVPRPKLKVPKMSDLLKEHEKEYEAKYMDYIKNKFSKERYEGVVKVFKKIHEVWLARIEQEKCRTKGKDAKFIDWEEIDMIPIYRIDAEEVRDYSEGEPKEKEISVRLSPYEVSQIPTLKKWGILHFDKTRYYICWGENGKKVAQIML
jgi:hypothetical protein